MSDARKPRIVPFDVALDRYLVANGLSRRAFLRRMAAFGALATIGGIVEACAAAASPTPTQAPTAAASLAPTAAPTPTPEPTPVPSPEAELNVYNWDGYIGSKAVADFSKKYG